MKHAVFLAGAAAAALLLAPSLQLQAQDRKEVPQVSDEPLLSGLIVPVTPLEEGSNQRALFLEQRKAELKRNPPRTVRPLPAEGSTLRNADVRP